MFIKKQTNKLTRSSKLVLACMNGHLICSIGSGSVDKIIQAEECKLGDVRASWRGQILLHNRIFATGYGGLRVVFPTGDGETQR